MTPFFDLTGLTAFVTGSSRGIGRATALALGRAGARVIFHGSRQSEALDAALAEARAAGIACEAVVGDIGNSDDIDRLSREAAAADIVVLNASAQQYAHIEDVDDELFAKIFDANVRGSFRFVKNFAPVMAARGFGRILCIGSVNQHHPATRLSLYAASKAAMRSLCLTAAQEYGPRGVTVNTLTPGVIATDRNAAALSNAEFADALRKQIPTGRFGTPDDCAAAALFLVSREASYVNGANLDVNGAYCL